MSLPPGFLDELRSRLSLSQVVGRKVMWDTRKSNQGKGDMWAPCPFHTEKTASFHVDDRKGFYYCFGCHAKGDAISFVRETENAGFMEAVEILAGEAGMPMPAPDPQAQQKADRRSQLTDVMETAVQYYRLQMNTAQGARARDYLAGRGLSEAAIGRWQIGFAPDVRQGIFNHLTGNGVAANLVVDAGLAAEPDGGGAPYDRFRGRIIFPIRDGRGRAIALGGRAMDPNARAKYLNSPETALFDKGRSLYNRAPAREAAGKGKPLIVAEGYMDVIALAEAGFNATVAPLGTAITEMQLQLMWRIHPEPIIALDGDTAGLRAAMRVIDRALPLLEAGQSLRFAMMPPGQDPDDVIRAGGATAMQTILEAAQPMVRLLWQRETDGRVFDSPERKAALDKDLRAAIGTIRDVSIRRHYEQEIKRLEWDLFNPRRAAPSGGKWTPRDRGPKYQPVTKASALVVASEQFGDELREAVILATLICHPVLLAGFEGELERLIFATPDHRRVQAALLTHLEADDSALLRETLEREIGPGPLEKLFSLRHVQIAPPMLDSGDTEKAAMCLTEELARLNATRGAAREIEDAMQEMAGLVDEGLTWRMAQVAQARNSAGRGDTDDTAEFDTAPNGARMNRDERSAFDALLDRIGLAKGPQQPS